jgi:hypothetical protein
MVTHFVQTCFQSKLYTNTWIYNELSPWRYRQCRLFKKLIFTSLRIMNANGTSYFCHLWRIVSSICGAHNCKQLDYEFILRLKWSPYFVILDVLYFTFRSIKVYLFAFFLKTKIILIYFPFRCLEFKYSVLPDFFILTSLDFRFEPLDFLEPVSVIANMNRA